MQVKPAKELPDSVSCWNASVQVYLEIESFEAVAIFFNCFCGLLFTVQIIGVSDILDTIRDESLYK